jgi:hypothetical protein
MRNACTYLPIILTTAYPSIAGLTPRFFWWHDGQLSKSSMGSGAALALYEEAIPNLE